MNAFTAKGNTLTELIREIFLTNGLLLEAGNQIAGSVGLSSARWQVLGIVEHGPVPVAQIARIWRLTRQAVQQTSDALDKGGFVEYLENPHHRRAKLVSITPKGTAALGRIRERHAPWANGIARHQELKALQAATVTLRNLRQTLESQVPDEAT